VLTADAQRGTVARAMGLAVATTACGSLALLMSGFDGLMQLGLLTAVGIVAAGVATWWLVPSLVPPFVAVSTVAVRPSEARWHVPKAVAFGTFAVLTIASLAFLVARPPWDDDPARMNPLPAVARRAGPSAARVGRRARRPLLRARARADARRGARASRDARRAARRLVERRQLGGYTLVTDGLPSEATQRRRLAMLPDAETLARAPASRRARAAYRPRPSRVRQGSRRGEGPRRPVRSTTTPARASGCARSR
jgi:predicted exporter